MLAAVKYALLSRAPAPVRDYVLSDCYVIAAGARLRGWTSAPIATAGLCPIVVTGQEWSAIVDTTLHESAHRWHAPPETAYAVSPTNEQYEAVLAYARREGWPVDAFERKVAAEERLATLCALAWCAA
jgi:hypothetical protein